MSDEPVLSAGGERRRRQTGGPTYYRPDDGCGSWRANERSGRERRVAHERRKQADYCLAWALKGGDTYRIQVVSGGVVALRKPAREEVVVARGTLDLFGFVHSEGRRLVNFMDSCDRAITASSLRPGDFVKVVIVREVQEDERG